ncbi:MAG: hypothetical protein ABH950_08215 [Candidatus Altiarchaeota archaeon]
MGDVVRDLERLEKIVPQAGLLSLGPKIFMDLVAAELKQQNKTGQKMEVSKALSSIAEKPEVQLTPLGRQKVRAMAIFSTQPKKAVDSGIQIEILDSKQQNIPNDWTSYEGRDHAGNLVGEARFTESGQEMQLEVQAQRLPDTPTNQWRLSNLINKGLKAEEGKFRGARESLSPLESISVFTYAKASDPVVLGALHRNGFVIAGFTHSENIKLTKQLSGKK